MLLRFWGTRGSIPAPVRPDQVEQKIVAALEAAGREQINLFNPKVVREFAASLSFSGSTAGGNTTCVTIELENDLIIFDAGSGIRELGDYLMDESNEQAKKFGFSRGKGHAYLFFTHTHWDHIQGLPFFKPIHVPGNVFDVYHIHEYVPDVLARQMEQEFFPLQYHQIAASLKYHRLEEGAQVEVAEATLTNIELKHPGKAYAYRVEADNAIAILATDGEYKSLDYASTKKYSKFYANADVLIFDAMFSVRESFVKEDWGHSSALIGADIAKEANVKRLILFHHDPASSDAEIMRVLQETKEYLGHRRGVPEVIVAQEGMEIELNNPPVISDFSINDQVEKGVIFMTLSGKFGAHATEQFRDHLARSLQTYQTDKVVLKMENLSELTIAGIRALVDARRSVLTLALVAVPENIYRVFELAGTTDFFAIYKDVDAALAALNSHVE
ncbi:MAG TPA: MBL fold metallo-hydrolase [Anaerolineae bacterium]|nr:MBL fold metallo-hydrolase [Anaerolineae bacterium]